MPERSALDDVLEYRDLEPPRLGLHTGSITDIVYLDKPPEKSVKTGEELPWLGIVVELTDQVNLNGEPYFPRVEVTRSMKPGSNLRRILTALHFDPSREKQFQLRQLCGVEVDVNIRHRPGANENYTFGNVSPDDVSARGEGAAKQKLAEIVAGSSRNFRGSR